MKEGDGEAYKEGERCELSVVRSTRIKTNFPIGVVVLVLVVVVAVATTIGPRCRVTSKRLFNN